MRGAWRHGVSFNLSRLLKITATTTVNNETLDGLGAQMPTATGVAFICTPAAAATIRPAVGQVVPRCLTSEVISLLLVRQKLLGDWAATKRGIKLWGGRWWAVRSEDPLPADPPAVCVVFSGSTKVKASISRTSAPDQSSRWPTWPRIASETTRAWPPTSWEWPMPACLSSVSFFLCF